MYEYSLSIICVILITIGQILFKYASIYSETSGTFMNAKSTLLILMAFFIYGASSILWIYILKGIHLGKVYPIMALAFIFVPITSHFLFQESLTLRYFLGLGILIIGIVITTSE